MAGSGGDLWDMLGWIPGVSQVENLFNSLTGRNASDRATRYMLEAIQKAMGEIQGAKKESMGYLDPYLKNAPQDYDRYRGMVQSGYFSQGAPTSFNPGSFSFDPSQGSANFQTNSFSPLGLPPVPQAPAPAGNPFGAPAPQGPTLAPQWGQPPSAQQVAQMGEQVGIGHLFEQPPRGETLRPDVSPNGFEGVPGAGMPSKAAMFLRMLGIDQYGNYTPWNPVSGLGRPNASGPFAPMGPGGSPTLPGRNYTPQSFGGGRPY